MESKSYFPKNWEEIKRDKLKCFNYNFKFKNGKTKRKKIKIDFHPKKLQGGSGGPQGIKIDRSFFEFKTDKEKIALLWHELYHCRSLFVFKRIWAEIKYDYFLDKEAYWEEEFEADIYSASQNSVSDCLNFLNQIKQIYDKDPSLYPPMSHPPIEERIKRIKELFK